MKKILKVKIKRDQSGGKTSYSYPSQYNPKAFTVISYETQLQGKYDEVVGRGNKFEYVIGTVEEADASSFLASPDITEITRTEAESFLGSDLTKSVNKITDNNAVMLILAKLARGEALTQDDKDSLNPEHPSRGISRSKTLKETLDDLGV